MSESVKITVPVPHRSLSPNARAHWAKKDKHKQAARQYAQMYGVTVVNNNPRMTFLWESVRFDVKWYGKTKAVMRMDRGNAIASLKATEDGIEDSGLILNDKGVSWGSVEFAHCAKDPRVELTITKTK